MADNIIWEIHEESKRKTWKSALSKNDSSLLFYLWSLTSNFTTSFTEDLILIAGTSLARKDMFFSCMFTILRKFF